MELKKIFLLIMFVIAYYCSLGQLPNNDPSWQLIFDDDFSGTSIDNSKWNSNYPWNQGSYLLTCDNNQNGYFDTISSEYVGYRTWNFENCELNNGVLKLISKQESYLGKVWDDWIPIIDPNTGDTIGWNPIETWHNFNYTTGMLYSKMKIRYGYFEIRCKLPEPQNPHETKGLGPNFWIFDGNCDIAEYSEIDVFEFASEYGNMVNMFTCNSHYRDVGGGTMQSYPIPEFFTIDFDDFHIFSAEWGADRIIYYIDNIPIFISPNPYPDDMCPMNIIVDINHPSNNFCDTAVSPFTVFPYIYEIDYVKVWQLKQHCDDDITICNFNPNIFDFAIYKSISIGGLGCTPTISSGENITLRATQSIVLDYGFTVESGAEFLAETTPCQQQEHFLSSKLKPDYPYLPPTGFIDRNKY